MDIDKVWEVGVRENNNDILVRGNQYQPQIATRLELDVVSENLRNLMVEQAVVKRDQLYLCRVSIDTELHTPLNNCISIPLATQFCLPTTFAISPVCIFVLISWSGSRSFERLWCYNSTSLLCGSGSNEKSPSCHSESSYWACFKRTSTVTLLD